MRRALCELRELVLEARDALIDFLDTVPVFNENQTLSYVVELKAIQPLPIPD